MSFSESIVFLAKIDSTNKYAMQQIKNGCSKHGMVYLAYEQTQGRGQFNRQWLSNAGENITLSLVLQPTFLRPFEMFSLSAAVSLACFNFFSKYAGDETKIKWVNDIYWRDRKAAGILIENIFLDQKLKWAIVGIGINVNQTNFTNDLVNPVSLKQITGKSFAIDLLVKELLIFLEDEYHKLSSGEERKIVNLYNSNLYKLNEKVKLKKQNAVFDAIVKGVNKEGKLIVQSFFEQEFAFNEIEWVKQ